jgi:hypothetical protein
MKSCLVFATKSNALLVLSRVWSEQGFLPFGHVLLSCLLAHIFVIFNVC